MKGDLKELNREKAGLLVLDVQERLFPHVENSCAVFVNLQKAIKGFQIFKLPIVVTEQYPEGLGHTINGLKSCLDEKQEFFSKTSFSCMRNEKIKQHILSLPVSQWVVVGLEAHICVFQSARDLLSLGKEVVVLNDAIASRSLYDFSTSISEIRDCGARVSSIETVLFELLKNSTVKEFKPISNLCKEQNEDVINSSCCGGSCQ